VDLPSEPEWEKAARGGIELPATAKIAAISPTLIAQLQNEIWSVRNPLPKRLYPWGNDLDTEKLNYGESLINQVSTLGCYPLGKSPYGCEDMAGNVWEWTRSAYKKNYPDHPGEWAQRDARIQSEVRRVLRGGAFNLVDPYVRCAARLCDNPDNRFDYIGFRPVLSPCL
jgi:iron(II)-dependent oxidoreductase